MRTVHHFHLKLDKQTLIAIAVSIFSFVTINAVFHLPLRLFWSAIISFLLFTLIKYLTGGTSKQYKVRMPTYYLLDAVLIAVCFVGWVLISLNPFSSHLPQFADWFSLPISGYIQFMSSVILTSFFSGYMILRISGITRKMPALAVFVFSIVLSLFLASTFFLLFVIYLKLDISLFVIILLLIDVLLVVCQITRMLTERRRKAVRIELFRSSQYSGACFYQILIIVLASLLIYSFVFSVLYYTSPLPYHDEWQHYGTANRILRFAQDGSITQFFSSPAVTDFWPCSYIASVNLLSGFPQLNVYYLLHFLVILPLLCVYLSYKSLFSKLSPKIPVVATIFTMFGGFGGLYALFTTRIVSWNFVNTTELFMGILGSGIKTYDINGLVVFHLAPYIAPAQIWGLASFLLLVLLVQQKIELGHSRWFLIAFIVAFGYLGHYSPEIFMFIISFFVISLFLRSYSASFIQKTGISIFFGLLIVLASDFLLPVRLYSVDSSYIFCLVGSVAIFFSSFTKSLAVSLVAYVCETKERTKGVFSKASQFLVPFALFSTLYIYILSLMIWFNILPSFEIGKTVSGLGVDFVPWYIYPVRLGITGLIFLFVLVGMIINSRFREKTKGSFQFCFLILIVSIVVGKLFHILPVYMESRLTTFMWFALSPIVAFALVNLCSSIKKTSRKVVSAVLVTLILIVGFLSPIYYVEYLSIYNETYVWAPYNVQASKEEFEGLQFLYDHSNSNTTVLTVTFESRFLIASFGGIPLEHVYGGDSIARDVSRVFLQPHDIETVLHILANSNVNYIYVASRDNTAIDTFYPEFREGFIFSFLLNYLPVVLNNSDVTIYQVPSFSAPHIVQGGISLLEASSMRFDVNLSDAWFLGPTFGEISQVNSTSYDGSLEIHQISGQDNDTWVCYVQNVNITTDQWASFTFTSSVLNSETNWLTVGLLSNDSQWISYFDHLNNTNPEEFTTTLSPGKIISQIRIYVETQPQTTNGTTSQSFIGNMFFELRKNDNDVIGTLALSQSAFEYAITPYDEKTFRNSSDIVLVADPLSWIPFIDWVKTGGRLTVLDFTGGSSFKNILSIDISNKTHVMDGLYGQNISLNLPPLLVNEVTSTDETVWSSCNFTSNSDSLFPMTMNKKLGLGTLTYAYFKPFKSSLVEGSDSAKREIFSKLGAIMASSIAGKSLACETISDNWSEWAVGKISFQGEISIDTSKIGITNPTSIIQIKYSEHNESFAFSNVTLTNLKATGNPTLFAASNGTLTENRLDGGGIIQLQNTSFSINLNSGDILSLKLSNESTYRTISGGKFYVESAGPTAFDVDMPLHLAVNGSIQIDKGYLYKEVNLPLSELYPVLIEGTGQFTISSMDNDIVVFDSRVFSGNVTVPGYILVNPEWSEFTFDHNLLFSTQNLIIVIVCIVFTLFLVHSKRLRNQKLAKV